MEITKKIFEELNCISNDVKEKSFQLCSQIQKQFNLSPIRVAPSVENAIFLKYILDDNHVLFIEVYDDLQISMMIHDELEKQILFSEEFRELSESHF